MIQVRKRILLNAFLFILIGLQLPSILDALEDPSILAALAVCAAVVLVRLAWQHTIVFGIRLLDRREI